MMIDKRLLGVVPESVRYIVGNVACQWCSLLANVALMWALTSLLAGLYEGSASSGSAVTLLLVGAAAIVVRMGCSMLSSRLSYLSSRSVKRTLRERIYQKLLRLGSAYRESVNTSEVVQVAVEGVDQLETYFGAYLPQFFYAMLAPVTLFLVLCPVNLPSAVVLLVCVPLIPVSIALVQTWAKKLLGKYWGQYTALGDTFLENLQGLTTLKIYQSDAFKQDEMNEQAERFRRITMKVLTMQLNSITIMDLIAYGGAAVGGILAVTQFRAGNVSLSGCLLIILLAADFFLPMRLLGSYFHIAMNGMAASGKIFRLLDLPEAETAGKLPCPEGALTLNHVTFAYEEGRPVLKDVSMVFPEGSFTALVGESGCGKSTAAALLMGRNKRYQGSVRVGAAELSNLSEASLMEHITYISHNSYLFKGTVRENLLMGKPDATDEELWQALSRANLEEFFRASGGLDTPLLERAENLSGGQAQRLALARALLHDSPVYIFDEATSNIDVESENDILAEIHRLAKHKTVLLISHRLANVTGADNIYVLEKGEVAEAGTHAELLARGGLYASLWDAQQTLEHYGEEVSHEEA